MKVKKILKSNKKIVILISLFLLIGTLFYLSRESRGQEVDYGKVDENIEITQQDNMKENKADEIKSNLSDDIKSAKKTITIKKGLASKWVKRTLGINADSGTETYTIGKDEKETSYGTFKVKRVVDGDTFIISNNKRIRMLEIDTPESVNPDKSKNTPFGKVASKYTKERLKGKKVKLTYDVEHQDKYGRELCYVYLDDGTFYNEELVRKGYAKALIMEPNTLHADKIQQAEKKAKEERIGVWQ